MTPGTTMMPASMELIDDGADEYFPGSDANIGHPAQQKQSLSGIRANQSKQHFGVSRYHFEAMASSVDIGHFPDGRALMRSGVAAVLLAVLLGFVSLLLAIASLVVAGMAGGARPDMAIAY